MRGQVHLCRERWLAASSQLATVEPENSSDRELMALIMRVLSDRSRPGTTNYFSTEQQKILDFIAYYNRTMAKPFVWKFEGYPERV